MKLTEHRMASISLEENLQYFTETFDGDVYKRQGI